VNDAEDQGSEDELIESGIFDNRGNNQGLEKRVLTDSFLRQLSYFPFMA